MLKRWQSRDFAITLVHLAIAVQMRRKYNCVDLCDSTTFFKTHTQRHISPENIRSFIVDCVVVFFPCFCSKQF